MPTKNQNRPRNYTVKTANPQSRELAIQLITQLKKKMTWPQLEKLTSVRDWTMREILNGNTAGTHATIERIIRDLQNPKQINLPEPPSTSPKKAPAHVATPPAEKIPELTQDFRIFSFTSTKEYSLTGLLSDARHKVTILPKYHDWIIQPLSPQTSPCNSSAQNANTKTTTNNSKATKKVKSNAPNASTKKHTKPSATPSKMAKKSTVRN